jgi:hypothetical protein
MTDTGQWSAKTRGSQTSHLSKVESETNHAWEMHDACALQPTCTHLTKHAHALAPPHSHLPTAMHASPPSGNGNVAVAIDAGGAAGGGVLVFRLDRNDAWVPATGDISCCGYDVEGAGARTVGAVTLRFDGAPGFEATQYITNATVYTSQVRELACFSSKLHVTP